VDARPPGYPQVVDLDRPLECGISDREGMETRLHTVLALAGRRHLGIVTRGELLAQGIPSSTIAHALRIGLLEKVHRGVYRVASAPPRPESSVLAAVRAVSDDAVASHLTAAALWGLADTPLRPPYHVTTAQRCQRQLDDVVVHRRALHRLDRTVLGPIPVTMVPRTAIDAAGCLGTQEKVDDLVIDGLRLRRADRVRYQKALERAGRAPGVGLVGRTLERFDAENAERLASRIETGFHLLFAEAEIPDPEVNRYVYEQDGLFLAKTDFGWEPPGVHLEVDGIRFHSLPSQKRYDDARQNRLVLSERIVLRYSYRDLLEEPGRIVAEVRRALDIAWKRRRESASA
jgi:hypothetical protein